MFVQHFFLQFQAVVLGSFTNCLMMMMWCVWLGVIRLFVWSPLLLGIECAVFLSFFGLIPRFSSLLMAVVICLY